MMKMINHYLNSLESYLPEDLKQEVRDELEASLYEQIGDQSAQLGRELNQQEQEALLKKIGHPMLVAAAYQPNQELVSREYFPAYKKALQISLSITLVVNLLAALPELFTGGHIMRSAFGLLGNLIDIGLWVFAIVTLVFYLMQKHGVSLAGIYAWSPRDLKAHKPGPSLNRLETFFGMAVETLFLAWWINWLSWPETISNGVSANIAMSPEWMAVYWSVNIIIGLSIALSLYKLIIAGWDRFSLIANLALNAAALVVLIQISRFENYVVLSHTGDKPAQWVQTLTILDSVILSILAGIGIYIIWESYCNLKVLRKTPAQTLT